VELRRPTEGNDPYPRVLGVLDRLIGLFCRAHSLLLLRGPGGRRPDKALTVITFYSSAARAASEMACSPPRSSADVGQPYPIRKYRSSSSNHLPGPTSVPNSSSSIR